MVGWSSACSSGNANAVRVNVHFRTLKAIRRGWSLAIKGGDYVDVARILLPHTDELTVFHSYAMASRLNRVNMLREILLPRCFELQATYGAGKQDYDDEERDHVDLLTFTAITVGHVDILKQLLNSRWCTMHSSDLVTIAVNASQPAALACVVEDHRKRMTEGTTYEPIHWIHQLLHARSFDMILLVEAYISSDVTPVEDTLFDRDFWYSALTALRMVSLPKSDGIRHYTRFVAERIKCNHSVPSDEEVEDTLSRVIYAALNSLIWPDRIHTLTINEVHWRSLLGAAHDLCTILGFERWWTQYTVKELVSREEPLVVEVAFREGWLTRAHLVEAQIFPPLHARQVTRAHCKQGMSVRSVSLALTLLCGVLFSLSLFLSLSLSRCDQGCWP
jgi:hypothetical protein